MAAEKDEVTGGRLNSVAELELKLICGNEEWGVRKCDENGSACCEDDSEE